MMNSPPPPPDNVDGSPPPPPPNDMGTEAVMDTHIKDIEAIENNIVNAITDGFTSIKKIIAIQNKTINRQNKKIADLNTRVDNLENK